MKAFRFPLERVLLWRAEQASLEELKLQQLRDFLSGLQQEKRRIEDTRLRSEQEVLRQAFVEAIELESLDAYRRHLYNKRLEVENREHETEVAVAQQRQRVLEARRNRELLERLKRKALEEWQRANDREQETLATELFLAKRVRLH